MSGWRRPAGRAAAAVGLAGAILFGATILAADPEVAAENTAGPSDPGAVMSVPALLERVDRVPSDWTAWAALGSAYVAQVGVTGDPTSYVLAEKALEQSLAVRPAENELALVGQATLAASRHDFAAAVRLAEEAKAINPYSARAHGVLVDALVELGRYDEALVELQRMVDLKPNVASMSRVSYYRELTGDIDGARAALEQAGRFAFSPEDSAFVEQFLGELAFNEGDLDLAAEHYESGLTHTPGAPSLIFGLATIDAARGNTEAALEGYRTVVEELPDPDHIIAYGDMLAATGRTEEAREQYEYVETVATLLRSHGANPDLELVLYEADHGRAESALRMAEREWDRSRSVDVHDAYGWALHVNGRDAEALEHAVAADALGGRNALFAYHRGMIEMALGMDDEAQASLARALDLNPYFSYAPIAQEALDELRTGS